MKTKDVEKLKAGNCIIHKHYGLCMVSENVNTDFGEWFGLIIKPLSMEGMLLLANHSQTLLNKLLEDSVRKIVSKVENPVIPKILYCDPNGIFTVREWDKRKEGDFDVDKEEFCLTIIKTYDKNLEVSEIIESFEKEYNG